MSYIYLASPYSNDNTEIRDTRARLVAQAMLEIAQHQVPVYSPITHWHLLAVTNSLPTDHIFWKTQNDALMKGSNEIWVLCIDGWRQSKGVEYEINWNTSNYLEGPPGIFRHRKLRHVTFESLSEACDLYKTAQR